MWALFLRSRGEFGVEGDGLPVQLAVQPEEAARGV